MNILVENQNKAKTKALELLNKNKVKEEPTKAEKTFETKKEENSGLEDNAEEITADNQIEMPSESFEELFQIAKECADSEESQSTDGNGDNLKVAEDDKQNVKMENSASVEDEKKSEIRGNYSKASADKIWKDKK